VIISV